MYRVLLILAIINFVEPRGYCKRHPDICPRHHHDYRKRHDERLFERLANDVIDVDNKARTFCTENENQENQSKEIFDQDVYKYIVTLPNFNESTIEVKIKHRVLFVKAEKANESKKYVAVRILPELLNTSAARWSYNNEELIVAMPYKIAVKTEALLTCGEVIERTIVSIPKSDYNLNQLPEIDARKQTESANITENIV